MGLPPTTCAASLTARSSIFFGVETFLVFVFFMMSPLAFSGRQLTAGESTDPANRQGGAIMVIRLVSAGKHSGYLPDELGRRPLSHGGVL